MNTTLWILFKKVHISVNHLPLLKQQVDSLTETTSHALRVEYVVLRCSCLLLGLQREMKRRRFPRQGRCEFIKQQQWAHHTWKTKNVEVPKCECLSNLEIYLKRKTIKLISFTDSKYKTIYSLQIYISWCRSNLEYYGWVRFVSFSVFYRLCIILYQHSITDKRAH